MSNPNEVMDIQYNEFEKTLRLTLSNNCYNPSETDHCWKTDLCRVCELDCKKIIASHATHVAQQNAALLRELDRQTEWTEYGWVLPESILEAKLKEIEHDYQVSHQEE